MSDNTAMTPEQLLFWLKGILDAERTDRKVPVHLIRQTVEESFKTLANKPTSSLVGTTPYRFTGGGGAVSAYAGEVNLAKTPTL